jgi:hypothetical protein
LPSLVHAAAHDPRTVGNTYPETLPQTPLQVVSCDQHSSTHEGAFQLTKIQRGGGLIPAGYNPFGYTVTELGEQFLAFGGSLDSDVGRFLASLKERKTLATIKAQWLEIVRVSKTTQSMRLYRTLQELIDFCLKIRLID